MQILSFDELNNLGIKTRSLPYSQYFGEMDLPSLQQKKRILFAEQLEEKIAFVLLLMLSMIEENAIDIDFAINALYGQYKEVCIDNGVYDQRMDRHIREISRDIVESTFDNLTDPYTISVDRVRFISENEANTSHNTADYFTAVKNGKQFKVWKDKKDNRERASHLAVDKKPVPINSVYKVGSSQMLFPKDTSLGADAKEIVNCRCVIEYV